MKAVRCSWAKRNWIAKTHRVQDGNIWTSTGVTAGIDATLVWVADEYREELAVELATSMKFTRAASPSDEPFLGRLQVRRCSRAGLTW
jgi:transcriptional regulator GlxA family with amidase domain